MKLTVSIESNGAGVLGDHEGAERDGGDWFAADALEKVARLIRDGYTSGPLTSYTGGTVGSWELSKGDTD